MLMQQKGGNSNLLECEDAVRQFVMYEGNNASQIVLFNYILQNTGYRLPIIKVVSKLQRDETLTRIHSDWKENEKRNKECRQKVELSIRCKSERLPTGEYQYKDMDKGVIPVEEFQKRYTNHLFPKRIIESIELPKYNTTNALDMLVTASMMVQNTLLFTEKQSQDSISKRKWSGDQELLDDSNRYDDNSVQSLLLGLKFSRCTYPERNFKSKFSIAISSP